MKKQNFIILGVFLLIVAGFYLVSCNISKEDNLEITIEEEKVEESNYANVYLVGQLLRTGSFTVPKTWTVKMLLDYAGVKADADLAGFNLELHVEDNKTYYVPKIGNESISYDEKVNINTADVLELSSLDGIGEAIALNIISYRQTSPFTSIEEIKNVNGIGDAVYEKIKNFITVR